MVSVPTSPGSRLFAGPRATWWRRIRQGRGFRYLDAQGRAVDARAALDRILHLGIPPAWNEVRIAPGPRSRIQAIGLDSRGRPQYLYHTSFVARQQRHKFAKIEHFGERLPHLREVTSQHLLSHGLGRERVMALMLRLVNNLYFRAGSEVGSRANRTFGITTLRKRHVRIEPDGRLVFSFDGKRHVHQRHILVDATIAGVLAELKQTPGGRLFQWFDEAGRAHAVRDRDANDYLKSIMGPQYTLKDFRTWHGTLIVAKELARLGPGATKTERKRLLTQAVKAAAERLGNTPAVCRRSYLHPMVVLLYEQGVTLTDVPINGARIEASQAGYRPEEARILEMFAVGRVMQHAGRRKGRTPIMEWWSKSAKTEARPVAATVAST